MRYRRNGNVLMRPSSDNQYALTVRTTSSDCKGTTKVSHYSVRRNNRNEFYVDIDIKHDPAPTLSDIFERFLDLAGSRNYRPFAPKSTDSGCLPEVNSSEASKLSNPVLPLISNPGSGSSSYVDMRSKSTRERDYLTTLPDDEDQDYLEVCGDNDCVPANRHASTTRQSRDTDYTNQNQNVSKTSASRKQQPSGKRQSEPAASGVTSRLQRPA